MSSKENIRSTSDVNVSIGAGLAIAGIWLAASATTIFIMLILFVWSPSGVTTAVHLDGWSALMLLVLIAAPMIAAYYITKVILNKED